MSQNKTKGQQDQFQQKFRLAQTELQKIKRLMETRSQTINSIKIRDCTQKQKQQKQVYKTQYSSNRLYSEKKQQIYEKPSYINQKQQLNRVCDGWNENKKKQQTRYNRQQYRINKYQETKSNKQAHIKEQIIKNLYLNPGIKANTEIQSNYKDSQSSYSIISANKEITKMRQRIEREKERQIIKRQTQQNIINLKNDIQNNQQKIRQYEAKNHQSSQELSSYKSLLDQYRRKIRNLGLKLEEIDKYLYQFQVLNKKVQQEIQKEQQKQNFSSSALKKKNQQLVYFKKQIKNKTIQKNELEIDYNYLNVNKKRLQTKIEAKNVQLDYYESSIYNLTVLKYNKMKQLLSLQQQ